MLRSSMKMPNISSIFFEIQKKGQQERKMSIQHNGPLIFVVMNSQPNSNFQMRLNKPTGNQNKAGDFHVTMGKTNNDIQMGPCE